jgi:hypothetical protein
MQAATSTGFIGDSVMALFGMGPLSEGAAKRSRRRNARSESGRSIGRSPPTCRLRYAWGSASMPRRHHRQTELLAP